MSTIEKSGDYAGAIDQAGGSAPQAAAGSTREQQGGPVRLSLVVLLLGVIITGALTWAAWTINDRNENRLLTVQVHEAAIVLAGAVPDIQTPLASAVGVAEATGGSAAKFETLMAPDVGPGRPFVGASLWEVGGASPHAVATVGKPSAIAGPRLGSFVGVHAGSQLSVTGLLDGGRRLGYAYGSAGTPSYVVYAESPLPARHRVVIPQDSAYSELNFALYLGKSERRSSLLETTEAQLPITGRRSTATVAFGDTDLTLVGTPTDQLGGALSRELALIVGVAGLLLTVAASLMTGRLVRRRWLAEELAAENRRLYGQQHEIAETLQGALLPNELPDIRGLEIETRYLPSLEIMDIGGDWYDVIARDETHFVFVVGDVSGRGLRAAMVMASLRYAIRAYVAEGDQPSAILTKLGALLQIDRDDHFATVLCGFVDMDRHQVTLASAGHFAPLMMSEEGGGYVDIKVGPPIGIGPSVLYASTTLSVPPQATLLAFTDGLIERRGESLDVGLERLRQSAMSEDRPLGGILTRIVADLTPQGSNDDTAILGVRWQN